MFRSNDKISRNVSLLNGTHVSFFLSFDQFYCFTLVPDQRLSVEMLQHTRLVCLPRTQDSDRVVQEYRSHERHRRNDRATTQFDMSVSHQSIPRSLPYNNRSQSIATRKMIPWNVPISSRVPKPDVVYHCRCSIGLTNSSKRNHFSTSHFG